jgi:hypothetical protein
MGQDKSDMLRNQEQAAARMKAEGVVCGYCHQPTSNVVRGARVCERCAATLGKDD